MPLRFAQCLLAFTVFMSTARAHNPGLSTLTVTVGDETIAIVEVFSPRDLAVLLNCDDPARLKDPRELQRYDEALKKLALRAVAVDFGTTHAELAHVHYSVDQKENFELHVDTARTDAASLAISSLLFDELPFGHRQFLTIKDASGNLLAEKMLSANAHVCELNLPPRNSASASSETHGSAFAAFLELGIKHILTGYDHILFLIGILLISQSFIKTAKIITCFTVAHSLTLALATLTSVAVPPSIVEPLIAGSIVYIGIENLVFKRHTRWRGLLVFAFGLIHGLGFASGLRELGIGSEGTGVVVPLLAFNLGVEFGQIAIALAVLPLIWRFQTKEVFSRRWVPACSVLISLAGTYWFIERCIA